jgi:hypothetical protein
MWDQSLNEERQEKENVHKEKNAQLEADLEDLMEKIKEAESEQNETVKEKEEINTQNNDDNWTEIKE